MSAPPLASKNAGARWYELPSGERFPSVTSILNVLNKPALPRWAAKEVALWVVGNDPAVQERVEADQEAAVETLKRVPWRKMEKAGDLGSLVHDVAECLATGHPLPDISPDAESYIESFMDVAGEWEFLATEATVVNREVGYAGTLDAVAKVLSTVPQETRDNRITTTAFHAARPLVVDYKTGKGVYPEAILQMAAYRFGEAIVLPDGQELPMPETEGAAVLHIRPKEARLIEVPSDESVFEVFRSAYKLWEWTQSNGQAL